jgi:hypothetical protein
MSILKSFLNNLINRLENPPKVSPEKKLDVNKTPDSQYKRDEQDKLTPNLYIGKTIIDNSMFVEVVDVHKTNIKVRILDIYWPRLGTYLDVGEIYPVYKHRGWPDDKLQVWEIAPKHMKRSTSQVIFQWEEGLGWCWDLDF